MSDVLIGIARAASEFLKRPRSSTEPAGASRTATRQASSPTRLRGASTPGQLA